MRASFQALLDRFARPLRFGLVGLSGVVVNSAVLWALVRGLRVPVLLGSAIATETAILSNFLLNDRWTFGGARERSLVQRLLRFNGVALGGLAITAGVLAALASYTRLHLLLANLLAIGGATAWNYVVNSRWTWSRSHVSSRKSQVSILRPATCDLRPDEEVPA
jgi:putative flippase GtrA